ncbi:DUF4190 domain-containing protein [Leifsonia sp. NPDC077715]|uniref:DUF4190 domain-containing protein n=1 Tax=Leifsonia sp. NPDC077715 TaxID=3155539 RepID=UPI00343B6725
MSDVSRSIPPTDAVPRIDEPRWNVLAIVGFVLSFGIGIAGVVLGIIALGRISKTGERGGGLAIASIVVGALVIVGTFTFKFSDWDDSTFTLLGNLLY